MLSSRNRQSNNLSACAKRLDQDRVQEKHSWVVFRFPEKAGEAHELEATAIKPVQRFAAQDTAILTQITALGFDPKALPKNKAGKAGVKSDVRKSLSKDQLFKGVKVFDKAWERLSARREIVIQD
jgi:hypothetical protein